MKVLKIVLIVIGVLIAVPLIASFFMSSTWEVETSITIDATPATIHPWLEDLHKWEEWGAWKEQDPAAEYTYEGPESGVGAIQRWNGETIGTGSMEITASKPDQGVWFDVHFEGFEQPAKGVIQYAVQGDATVLTWTTRGDVGGNVLYKLMVPMIGGMVRDSFDQGLSKLKQKIESAG